eukprot:3920047-Pyramimonas_sp.AAC.1
MEIGGGQHSDMVPGSQAAEEVADAGQLGCGRYPRCWSDLHEKLPSSSSADDLSEFWGTFLHVVDLGHCDRRDVVGAAAHRYAGHGGPLEMQWRRFQYMPRHGLPQRSSEQAAWSTAARLSLIHISEPTRPEPI